MTCCTILTDPAIGGTFLAWSWHWLKGDKEYYSVNSDGYVKLFSDPLNQKNSHNFVPNQPISIETFDKNFNSTTQHIYFHNFRDKKTNQAIEKLKTSNYKITLVTKSDEYALYSCSLKNRSVASPSFMQPDKLLVDDVQILLDQLKFFFGSNYNNWLSQNLTNVWDLREFIALNQRPLENNTIKNCHAFDFEYFDLPAIDVWKKLDVKLKDWFEYYDAPIDQLRLEHWLQVYKRWQQLHIDRITFSEQFNNIINSILTNQDLDLTPFNLDIIRESAIQHVLIYKHNLNLKTWQLEKFENTKQLYNLLEPNTHPLSS